GRLAPGEVAEPVGPVVVARLEHLLVEPRPVEAERLAHLDVAPQRREVRSSLPASACPPIYWTYTASSKCSWMI
ncbi:MAG: hypothetical protein R6X32_22875, partial [Chloroflexota bacterium]